MWKKIEDYEQYEVSDAGFVRNTRTGMVLKNRPDKNGYSRVDLYSADGKQHTKKVHRLVAQAYLGYETDRDQINHKNGIKNDNRIENLEWCTRSENTRHAYENHLFQFNIKPAITAHTKIFEQDKSEIIRMRNAGVAVKDIAKRYNVSLNTIYEVLKGR